MIKLLLTALIPKAITTLSTTHFIMQYTNEYLTPTLNMIATPEVYIMAMKMNLASSIDPYPISISKG
jgi:hypothetical protein